MFSSDSLSAVKLIIFPECLLKPNWASQKQKWQRTKNPSGDSSEEKTRLLSYSTLQIASTMLIFINFFVFLAIYHWLYSLKMVSLASDTTVSYFYCNRSKDKQCRLLAGWLVMRFLSVRSMIIWFHGFLGWWHTFLLITVYNPYSL